MFFNFAGTLPIAATEIATQWDHLYLFLLILSLFFFGLVLGLMIYFAIKFNKRKNPKPTPIEGNHLIEIIWTVVPTVLVMVLFVWGWVVYKDMVQAPPNAYEIKVVGKQWQWLFQYEDGRVETNVIYVPAYRPVKLLMTSEDVLHSFFVPNFRIKQDVVPGMYTSVWFEAKIPGRHQVYCAEYCGGNHSAMLADLVALDEKDWKSYLKGKKPDDIPNIGVTRAAASSTAAGEAPHSSQGSAVSLVDQGKRLMATKGCVACHSDNGVRKIGPSYKGLFESSVELSNGMKVVADENYLRESIELPGVKIVKGFSNQMPTYRGQISDQEMNALISYIRSLK